MRKKEGRDERKLSKEEWRRGKERKEGRKMEKR